MLAQTVPHIKSSVLLITVGVGVGFFMTVCMLRILTVASLRWLLIACYALIFVLAVFTDRNYLSICLLYTSKLAIGNCQITTAIYATARNCAVSRNSTAFKY